MPRLQSRLNLADPSATVGGWWWGRGEQLCGLLVLQLPLRGDGLSGENGGRVGQSGQHPVRRVRRPGQGLRGDVRLQVSPEYMPPFQAIAP